MEKQCDMLDSININNYLIYSYIYIINRYLKCHLKKLLIQFVMQLVKNQ